MVMASTTYENILREVEQLPLDEQRKLRDALIARVEDPPIGRGAAFISYLESLPFDEAERVDVERMEQAIEEECERIEPL